MQQLGCEFSTETWLGYGWRLAFGCFFWLVQRTQCLFFIFYFFAARRLSLVAASRRDFLVTCVQLLIAGATVVAEHRLWSTGSVLTLHGLSCCEARGILPHQGSNPGPVHWQVDYLPLHHQGGTFNWALCMLIHCQRKLGSSTNNWEI